MQKLSSKVDINIKRTAVFLFVLLVIGCVGDNKGQEDSNSRPETDCIVKITPVKNQGNSSLCWVYAMLATIESNHLMMGDSVNLSVDYVTRKLLEEETERHYLSGGKEPITTRGMAPKLLRLIMRHGLTHYDAYHADANMDMICRKLERESKALIAKRAGLDVLRKRVTDILDDNIRPMNKDVFMLGAKYTPLEFAHSVCHEDEYIAMTSFMHHPFGEEVELEMPDNHDNDVFLNVPLDSLQSYTERSLRSGRAVCWEGDISEPGFSFSKGFMVLRNDGTHVTQEMRQRDMEKFKTTDDHCMELIGMAHDKQGRKYFICKNSWGDENPFHGLMYMSESYFRSKTIAIVKVKK